MSQNCWTLVRWRNVLFSDESRFLFHRTDGRQLVWGCRGELNADVTVVCRVAHGSGGILVWAEISHGHRAQQHAIVSYLNDVRYRDGILRPIALPFIRQNSTIFQHDNARPHIANVYRELLDDGNICVPDCPAYSPDFSPIEYVWDVLDQAVRRRLPLPVNNDQLRIALQEQWKNIPQVTTDNFVIFIRSCLRSFHDIFFHQWTLTAV